MGPAVVWRKKRDPRHLPGIGGAFQRRPAGVLNKRYRAGLHIKRKAMMRMTKRWLVPVLAGLLGGTLLAQEAAVPPAEAPQVRTVAMAIPYRGSIAAVDAAAKTFTLKGKSIRVFAITSSTKLLKESNPGAWEDVKVGEYVRGNAVKKAEGQYEAMSVKLGPKPEKAK